LEDLVFHGETGLFLNCDSSSEGMLLGYPQNNAEEQPGHESQILCDAGSMMAHEDDATGQTVVTTSESANRLLDEWLLPGSGNGGSQALEKEEQCFDDCVSLVPSLMQKPEIKETNGNEFFVSERRISTDRKRSSRRAFEETVESLGEGESGGIGSVEVNTKTAGSSSGVEMTDASDHDKGRGAAVASSNVRTPTSSPEEDSDPKRQIRYLFLQHVEEEFLRQVEESRDTVQKMSVMRHLSVGIFLSLPVASGKATETQDADCV
jgi:hypothetical protein